MKDASEQSHYHIGSVKQASLILHELLPAIESLILKANKDFFTIKETMQILSISRSQLYYLRKEKILDSRTVGRKVYIPKVAINDLVMNSAKQEKLP
jgi:hypothetical protein